MLPASMAGQGPIAPVIVKLSRMSLEMLHNSLDASGRDTELLVAAAWWPMERSKASASLHRWRRQVDALDRNWSNLIDYRDPATQFGDLGENHMIV